VSATYGHHYLCSETLLGMSNVWMCVISAGTIRGFVVQAYEYAASVGSGESPDLVC
jgi:hypothetical protein